MNSLRNSNIIRRGKRLAFLLRHDRNYPFDEHGWREISDLITHHGYTMDELKVIVETNNKQRYEFSEDMTRIRARQGHSVQVDVELEEKLPPDVLYHGTGEQSLASIMEHGINKGNRLYVHLSKTSETIFHPLLSPHPPATPPSFDSSANNPSKTFFQQSFKFY